MAGALAMTVLLGMSDARAQRRALDLQADQTQIEIGETVTFTVEGAPSLRRPPLRSAEQSVEAAYVFSFGDGGELRTTEPRASHAYQRAGTFPANVRVEQNGDPVTSSEPVRIAVTAPPTVRTVRLVARPTEAMVGERVGLVARVEPAFDPADRLSRRIRYEFRLGDGTQQVTRSPEAVAIYRRPDRYRPIVRVLLDGEEVAASPPVEVVVSPEDVSEPVAPPPTVRLLVSSSTVTEGESVSFVAAVDPPAAAGAYEYLFDFGDGESQRGWAARVSYRYLRPGPFDAVVHLFRRGERVARSEPRRVEAQPRVPVENPVQETEDVTPPRNPPEGAQVGETTPPAETEADVPAVTEDDSGQLVDPSPDANPDTLGSEPGSVGEAGPTSVPIRLTVRPETPRAGEAVTFAVIGVRPGNDVRYRFDFGDRQTSGWIGVREVETTYDRAGTYTAMVEVRGPNGGIGEARLRVTVAAPVTAPPASIPLWLLVVLVALGLAGVLGWRVYHRRKAGGPAREEPGADVTPAALSPMPVVALASRLGAGTTRIAVDHPLTVELELRVRPVDEPGRCRIETRDVEVHEIEVHEVVSA